MLKKLFSFLLLISVAFTAIILMQPKEMLVKEQVVINASPEAIFKEINNFHNWHAWSPWANLDPNANEEYTGSVEGVGAIFSWSGNRDVGVGSMSITKSHPFDHIEMKLDVTAPYASSGIITFELIPEADNSTNVIWTLASNNNFMGKAICLLFNCKKMIGTQYAQGLNNLKNLVENTYKSAIDENQTAPSESAAYQEDNTEEVKATEASDETEANN